MKKIVMYEPSIGSDNLGDQIIVESIKCALNDYLHDSFVIELPTHTPVNVRYLHFLDQKPADMKFVCGSNIITNNLFSFIHLRQWNIPLLSLSFIGPLVFIGVGAQKYNKKINKLSILAYKKIMKNIFLHSVRDTYTENILKNHGINNVINTACPTMWGLTEGHCKMIPFKKAYSCIVTLTDYNRNLERDNYIIRIIKKNYKDIYFWPQGNRDFDYFSSLEEHKGINIISPNLSGYDKFLDNNDTDYVGTRLHGGIRALQRFKRTIIIGIDNRASELHKDFNIPFISQNELYNLDDMINSPIITRIDLPEKNINIFLQQFKSTGVI